MGQTTGPLVCRTCDKGEDEVRLTKCPICFKPYCGDCAYQHGGRTFCSQHCAEYFFFADPDDEDA